MTYRSTLLLAVALAACAKKPAPVVPVEPETPVVSAPAAPKEKPARKPATSLSIRFDFDSDAVKNQSALRVFCAGLAGRPVTVDAYASAERSGKYPESASQAYNLLLSTARAEATAFHARVAGCNVVQVTGHGETWQFGRTLPPNRRAVVKVIQ